MRYERFAIDFGSARTFDANGYMHVEGNRLSKACVSPYRGFEIERWQELGLDQNKIYQIYRPAEELAKAAFTFDGMPLMDNHIMTSSSELEKPKVKSKVVGAIGSGVKMVDDYLVGPITIWTDGGQEGVKTKQQADISCGYRYSLDTTPGVTPDGVAYDMKMVDISANHVALVPLGRVPGAMVADGALPCELVAAALRACFASDDGEGDDMSYDDACDVAEKASKKAERTGKPEHHGLAQGAHSAAAALARKAGNFGISKDHQVKAAYHGRLSGLDAQVVAGPEGRISGLDKKSCAADALRMAFASDETHGHFAGEYGASCKERGENQGFQDSFSGSYKSRSNRKVAS